MALHLDAGFCIFTNIGDSYVQPSASLKYVHEPAGELVEMQALIQEARLRDWLGPAGLPFEHAFVKSVANAADAVGCKALDNDYICIFRILKKQHLTYSHAVLNVC